MSTPDVTPVSVVIPVYRGGDDFARCLRSVAAAKPQPLQVIVVVDGDGPADAAIARQHGATVIEIPGPGGPARARNVGARAAEGRVLFFTDADIEVAPETVGQIAGVLQRDDAPAAVIGSYDDTPAHPGFLSQLKNLSHHYVHQQGDREAFTFWGACGGIRRDVFLAMGGFDESYTRPTIEDIELGYRLVAAGHRIELRREIQVKHLKHWTVAGLLRSDFRDRGLPWSDLILRHGQMATDLNLSWQHRAIVMVSMLLVVNILFLLVTAIAGWSTLAVASAWSLLLLVIAWVGLTLPFLWFLCRKRGIVFMACAAPWHWIHYLCGGTAFLVAYLRHFFSARRTSGAEVDAKDPSRESTQ